MGHVIGANAPLLPPTITGTVLLSTTEAAGLWWGPDTLNPYHSLRDLQPDAIIGNIILVYHGTFNLPLLAAQTNASAATTLLRRHHLAEALTLAQTAAQQAPEAAEIQAVLGQTLLASGRIPEGQQAIAIAIHLAQTIHPETRKRYSALFSQPPPAPSEVPQKAHSTAEHLPTHHLITRPLRTASLVSR